MKIKHKDKKKTKSKKRKQQKLTQRVNNNNNNKSKKKRGGAASNRMDKRINEEKLLHAYSLDGNTKNDMLTEDDKEMLTRFSRMEKSYQNTTPRGLRIFNLGYGTNVFNPHGINITNAGVQQLALLAEKTRVKRSGQYLQNNNSSLLKKMLPFPEEINDKISKVTIKPKSLQKINFEYKDDLTDDAITWLPFGFPDLTEINLTYTQVRDPGVVALANGCPQLTKIWLNNTQVSDVGVEALGNGCPKLTTIGLNNTFVGLGGVRALANGCHKLTTIGLNNTVVGGASVRALANGCPKLTTIGLNNTSVGNKTAKALADGCPELTKILVAGTQVDNIGIGLLVIGCIKLTYIMTNDMNGGRLVLDKENIELIRARLDELEQKGDHDGSKFILAAAKEVAAGRRGGGRP